MMLLSRLPSIQAGMSISLTVINAGTSAHFVIINMVTHSILDLVEEPRNAGQFPKLEMSRVLSMLLKAK